MSATIADLKASISISGADKAKSDLGGIGKSVGSMGDSFKHGLATVTGFITGFAGLTIVSDAIGLVKDQLVGMFQAAIDEQKIMGQLNAAIKSTHDVSGMTADSLKALADKIEGFSGIDDAAVKSGEAMLLTFTNIGKNVFPDVTQAVADMATAMNGGAIPTADQMRATALQVGKALNDPINGMATLQRVGVKLSETQKDQVKHFMAIGDTADAQKVILGELNKEFGGSAKAAGETLPGQLARLQNSLQDTGKGILSGLMPTLSDLLENHILPLADQFGKWLPGAIKQAQTSLTDLWKQIGPIAIDVKDFAVNAWGKLQAAFKDPATQKQMGNFGDIVGKMSDAFQKAWPSIKQFAETTGKDLLDAMKAAWPKIEEGRKAFADFTTDVINRIGPIVKEWWPKIKTGLEALQKVWNTAWPTMQQTLGMAWGVIQGVVQVGWNIISGIIKVGMDILSGNWGKAWDDLKSALSGVWQGMQQIAKSLFQKLHDTIMEKLGELHDNATAKANDLKNSIVSTIQALPGKLGDLMKQAIDNMVQALKDGAGRVKDAAGNLLGGIHVPGFASGTNDAPGGLAQVHKDELIYLPQHSVVVPATQSRAMLANGGGANQTQAIATGRSSGWETRPIVVNVNGADYNSTRALAREVESQIHRKLLLNMY